MIETARLRLRPVRADDLDSYQALIYGDADVMRYLPGGVPRPIERTQAALNVFIQHQAQHGFSVWAVELKCTGEFIGQAGIFTIPNATEIEVAYAFGKAHWGKGYASEAAYASLRYGFETANLPYILAVADVPNIASQRVMQKIGMHYVGVTTEYYDHTELVLYRMDRDDFKADGSAYRVVEG